MQVIFHIDLNAFYANCEIAANPSLKNKPIVVLGMSKRSIITTASYEARKYGIHSAMPLFQAQELCNELIVVEMHRKLYEDYSSKFFDIIAKYSNILEVASIDECYLDVTHIIRSYTSPLKLAKIIQDDVLNTLGLPCSIGIAPNKFLAKMASDMKKPLGITMITSSNLKSILWPLPISNMFGIGKKTAPKLEELGIKTIGDLAKYENYALAKTILGKNTLLFYRKANGIDNSNVDPYKNELKSVGNSTTLDRDTNDEEEIKEVLKYLCHKVSQRAKKRNLISNSLSITLKYTRFESVVRSITLKEFTNDENIILDNAYILFRRHFDGRPIRLAGVSLNNVISQKDYKAQISLFERKNENNHLNSTDKLIQSLNKSLGKDSQLIKASSLDVSSIQKKYLKNDE